VPTPTLQSRTDLVRLKQRPLPRPKTSQTAPVSYQYPLKVLPSDRVCSMDSTKALQCLRENSCPPSPTPSSAKPATVNVVPAAVLNRAHKPQPRGQDITISQGPSKSLRPSSTPRPEQPLRIPRARTKRPLNARPQTVPTQSLPQVAAASQSASTMVLLQWASETTELVSPNPNHYFHNTYLLIYSLFLSFRAHIYKLTE